MSFQVINEPLTEEPPTSTLADDALLLLKQLIATPSLSGSEDRTADLIQVFLENRGIKTRRLHHNVWSYNQYFSNDKPTILLNSHHDTVKPNGGYSRDPYCPEIIDGKLYGLGSNDAGGCLVSLLSAFIYFYNIPDLAYNLCFAATAEEENSGDNGLKVILPEIGRIDFAIVGEPTQMNMAIAEMGCMVLDCTTFGKAGHAARNEGTNALYKALPDITWFSDFMFPKQSGFMGPVKMTVTEINAGIQHNIVPHECHFTVDVRLSDCYSAEEVLTIIKDHTSCEVVPRQGILHPSCLERMHPVVRTGVALGLKTYVSPTSSDQGWLNVPSLKMGPGDSARSHMADEYIMVTEISEGINIYIHLLRSMLYCLIHNPEIGRRF
ncbi:M20 family metallo-hydrolase [Mucilaginibacter sabulilitoris]|uniref:M20 family metallo-hydrolase n=1 Tax=Mucilaginibacter sabulilitoris TaxID=1173583 RepID=A0ABZ0TFW2_9SPHI|nr:M20 family metallo-hydrolase [Mucilaginibacter sabulilitoris]WPU92069.1 M20 family metallo-hydrolase [Mucilaginibacter sabulilitoris]